ncbi:MAG: sensor domain-containing diguanylate cyclase, partial [Mycobacterium sp.]|nr:sensor domain-containing diguanylate cyclase [Mycobacterium sp.]
GADLDPGVLGRAGGREPATHHGAGGQALSVRVLVIATADGYVIVCETTDATERNEDRFRAVLDLLHDGVVIVGSDGRFEFTNVAACRMLGSPAEDLVGVHHSSQGVDLPLYDAQGQRISIDSHPIRWIQKTGLSLGGQVVGVDRIDGKRIWVMGHGCLIDPGDPENSSVLLSFTDITEHHDARERLLHDATHDWLTGLPNRGYALDQAALALKEHGSGRLSAVLFIDLDRLKAVNDSHGHPIGDDVLRIAATRMQSVTRAQDLVARIGGDEFVVLLIGPVEGGGPEAIARRLHDVLAEDIVVGTLTLRIGASIGITTVDGDDKRSLADVLRDADAAMYKAKGQGPAKTAHFEDERPDRDH